MKDGKCGFHIIGQAGWRIGDKMDKHLKRRLIEVGFGIVLFVALIRFHEIWKMLGNIISMFQPLVIGLVLAFVLNVPMKKIEGFLRKNAEKRRKEWKPNRLRALSLVLTLTLILTVICILCVIVVPQITASVINISELFQAKIPEWIDALEKFGIDTVWLETIYTELVNEDFMVTVTNGIGRVITLLSSTLSTAVGFFAQIMMALVFMIYGLLDKERLSRQVKNVLVAYLPQKVSEKLIQSAQLLNDIYASFLGKQCVEAVILGSLMWIAFMVFRLPYSGLVAVLTALLSFIPYIGSFLSCAVGAFVIFMVSPVKAVISIVVYQVVQFIENQFIYPRVVGGAVGLPPIWTLFAVFLGGQLFGIIGMIFFIPMVATAYTLIAQAVSDRLGKKT